MRFIFAVRPVQLVVRCLRFFSLVQVLIFGFFVVVLRAYLLHMNINCGCFATPEPIGPRKILEDAALSGLALLMTVFAFIEARRPHPWSVPEKA